MSPVGPSRQAVFFGPTVANRALRTWLDLPPAPTQFAGEQKRRRRAWHGTSKCWMDALLCA